MRVSEFQAENQQTLLETAQLLVCNHHMWLYDRLLIETPDCLSLAGKDDQIDWHTVTCDPVSSNEWQLIQFTLI